MFTCDVCGDAFERDEVVMEVRLPRPSDPSDLCCVMAGHKRCLPASKSCKPAKEWEDYFDSGAAARDGYLWLT